MATILTPARRTGAHAVERIDGPGGRRIATRSPTAPPTSACAILIVEITGLDRELSSTP